MLNPENFSEQLSDALISTDFFSISRTDLQSIENRHNSHLLAVDNSQTQSKCKSVRIIVWLRNKGVEPGSPDQLLRGHREEQKREIGEKMGRKCSNDFTISSSLLARRCKKQLGVIAR